MEVGDTTVLKSSLGAGDLTNPPKISWTCRALGWCILFFAGLWALPNPAVAQGVSIQGHVADPQGNAVLHAAVRLVNSEDKVLHQAFTGNEGQFSFRGVAAGKYTLKVVVTGFEPVTQALLIVDTQPLTIDIQLKIAPKQQTVSVTADVKEGNVLAPDPADVATWTSARSIQSAPPRGWSLGCFYWCVSAEAAFSACFAADLLSAELIVGLSV